MAAPATNPATLRRAVDGRGRLRFLTCGSVDDGKSTLIGRLLHDAGQVFDDQLAAVERDSRSFGTTGGQADLALLLDGLEAEREQKITIDVGYRAFATGRRAFIVADAPGHEQYTRNMATAASNSELAVLLVDARKGVLAQTRRHAAICSLLSVRHVVLAVNKMDLVGHDQVVFERIVADFTAFAARLSFRSAVAIPVSAINGDNVHTASPAMPWYRGPTLLAHLETVEVDAGAASQPFRFPVQWINRPHPDFRGLSGTIVSGGIRRGDAVTVADSGAAAAIAGIVTADGELEQAYAGDAVTLTLSVELDVVRGDVLARPAERPTVADQFAAQILWMASEPLAPGRHYLMRIGTRWVPATVTQVRHKLDLDRFEPVASPALALNDIGLCELSTASAVAFDAYADNRETGAFILVDRASQQTVAAGMISSALRRATNIHREALAVDKLARAQAKGQWPCIVWFTGLPAAGKSTVARLVEARLHAAGHHSYMLDGDNLRHGLNRDLGFTGADRDENIRRVGEVAKLFVDAGLIVLCAFISPLRAERNAVRELVGPDEFLEIFVDTPITECERRDPKGQYARARSGAIKDFTGVDSPYEPPEHPDLVLRTTEESAERLADRVIAQLRSAGRID